MNRIAVVEDNERMGKLVCKALSAAGIEADAYNSIAHAWAGLAQLPYAALVLDRGLPDGDGVELLRRLRIAGTMTPCLMLTARDALHDRIAGLEAGADDYLSKPFEMEEMVARVRALIRRPPLVRSLRPSYSGIEVVPEAGFMRATSNMEVVTLAPAEMQVMLSLVEAGGSSVRRSRLDLAGWGLGQPVTSNALDVALHRLRRKLQAIGAPVRIVNMRGHGYALQEGADEND